MFALVGYDSGVFVDSRGNLSIVLSKRHADYVSEGMKECATLVLDRLALHGGVVQLGDKMAEQIENVVHALRLRSVHPDTQMTGLHLDICEDERCLGMPHGTVYLGGQREIDPMFVGSIEHLMAALHWMLERKWCTVEQALKLTHQYLDLDPPMHYRDFCKACPPEMSEVNRLFLEDWHVTQVLERVKERSRAGQTTISNIQKLHVRLIGEWYERTDDISFEDFLVTVYGIPAARVRTWVEAIG